VSADKRVSVGLSQCGSPTVQGFVADFCIFAGIIKIGFLFISVFIKICIFAP
jgi:NADH:ubiquinone oxidoreductase subunit 4 (subunit M)